MEKRGKSTQLFVSCVFVVVQNSCDPWTNIMNISPSTCRQCWPCPGSTGSFPSHTLVSQSNSSSRCYEEQEPIQTQLRGPWSGQSNSQQPGGVLRSTSNYRWSHVPLQWRLFNVKSCHRPHKSALRAREGTNLIDLHDVWEVRYVFCHLFFITFLLPKLWAQ